jgi:hypothetical protein
MAEEVFEENIETQEVVEENIETQEVVGVVSVKPEDQNNTKVEEIEKVEIEGDPLKPYRFNGSPFSEKEIQEAADVDGLTLDEYLKQHSKDVYKVKPIEEVELKINFEDFKFKSEEELTPKLKSLYPGFIFTESVVGSDVIVVENIQTGKSQEIKLAGEKGTNINYRTTEEDSKSAYDILNEFINDNPETNETSQLIYNATGLSKNDGLDSIEIFEDNNINFKRSNEKQAINIIEEFDILQKDAFRNPWKYGFGNENTPGKERFTLTEDDHEQILKTLSNELRDKTGLRVSAKSLENIYKNLKDQNKLFVEQEYDENRSIELSGIDIDPEFKKNTIESFNSKLTPQELKNQELSIKQGDISKDINILEEKIKQVDKKELTIEYDEEAKENELKALDLQLINKQGEWKVLQIQRDKNATTTVKLGGTTGRDATYTYNSAELTKNFFNQKGFSEATQIKMANIAEGIQSNIQNSIESQQQSNPLLTQREAIGEIFNKQILNLQTLRKEGSDSKIKLKIPAQGVFWNGSTVGRRLKEAGFKLDENNEVELSLLDLRNAGINEDSFEGFFDEMLDMASEKDVEAIKIYNEEFNEVEASANAYWNLYANNVDISAIEKDGFLKTLATSTFVSALEKFGYDDKEAKNIVYDKGMSPQDRINAIDQAILQSAYEVKDLSGFSIELTPEQKEAVKVSTSNQIAQGIGGFLPEMPLLIGGGQVLNAFGWKKYYDGLKGIKKFVIGAMVEEVQMQVILDAELGTGASFYGIGRLGRESIKWGKNYRSLKKAFEKVVVSGPLGAVSSEVAGAVNAAANQIMEGDGFAEYMKEMYGDISVAKQRIIVNAGTFTGFGMMSLKPNDFKSTKAKIELVNELQLKLKNLRAGPIPLKIDKADISVGKKPEPKLRNFDELSSKEQTKAENLLSTINSLQDVISYELAYVELLPPSRDGFESNDPEVKKKYEKEVESFKNNLIKRYVDPWTKGIQDINPDFKGVNIAVGRGARFRKDNFTNKEATAEFDPNTNTITIDMDLYTPGKEIHELAHVASKEYFKKNPAALENLANELGDRFKDYKFGDFNGKDLEQRIIDKYKIDIKTPKGKRLLAEEYISFMGEYLSSPQAYYNNPDLASSLLSDVKSEIKDILKGTTSPIPQTSKDIVTLLSEIGKGGETKVDVASLFEGIENLNKGEKGFNEVNIDEFSTIQANKKADLANIEKEIRTSLDLEGTVVKKTTKEIVEDNRKLRAEILKNTDGKPNRKQRDQIVNNNKNLIYSILNKYETITGFKLSKNIKEEAAFELQLKLYEYAERYDANKNDVGAYLNMGFTKQVVNTLKKVGSFDREVSESDLGDGESGGLENLVDQTFSTSGGVSSIREEFIDPSTGKLDATTVLQEPEVTVRLLDNRIQNSNLIIDTYKQTPDLSNVSKDFGVKDGKVNNEDGTFKGKTSTRLSTPEVLNSQKYILENAEMLYELLPDGKTTKTAKESLKETSTGVQPVLLDAFYEIGDRVSTAAGLKGQGKLPFNRSEFLDYFGIKEDGTVFETIKENGKIDQRIKALIHQSGKAITNAEIRKIKDLTANQIEDLKSGKSEALASVDLGGEQAFNKLVEKLNNGETITVEDKKLMIAEYRPNDFMTQLIYNSTEDQLRVIDDAIWQTRNDARQIVVNQRRAKEEGMTPKQIVEMEKDYISRWSKKLPIIGKEFGIKDLKIPVMSNITSPNNGPRTIKSFSKILKKFPELLENDAFSKYVRNTFGEGALKTFGLKEYKKNNGETLSTFGKEEFKEVFKDAKGEGETLDFMKEVYQPSYGKNGLIGKWEKEIDIAKKKFPNWETTGKNEYEAYLVGKGRDFLSNPNMKVDGKFPPDAYERTMAANRKAIEYTYEKLAEVYREAPTKETLEDIISFLQIQTNQGTGILKGLAPVEFLSTVGEAVVPGGKKFYNEHNKDLFIYNNEFISLLSKSGKLPLVKDPLTGELVTNPKLLNAINKIVNSISQSLTSVKQAATKDAKENQGAGASIFPGYGNKKYDTLFTGYLTKEQAPFTLDLTASKPEPGKVVSVADSFIKENGKKNVLAALNNYAKNGQLNAAGYELLRVVENREVVEEVKVNNNNLIKKMGGGSTFIESKVESKNEIRTDAPGVEATRRRDEAGKVSWKTGLGIEKVKSTDIVDIEKDLPKEYKMEEEIYGVEVKGKKGYGFDFDDTLSKTDSKVYATSPKFKDIEITFETNGTPTKETIRLVKEGKIIELNAGQWAERGEKMAEDGFKIKFDNFDAVVDPKPGPLLEMARRVLKKRGKEDAYIITARDRKAQRAIFEYLKEQGVEFKFNNIYALGNSSGKAKADLLVKLIGEKNYNDIFFGDDATNVVAEVKKVLDLVDIKSTVQQVRSSMDLSEEFNKNLEESSGIGREKVYSPVKAKLVGATRKRQRFFIPSSAEDFTGLLYTTLGKGKEGEAHMAFYQKNLLDPYNRGVENLAKDRVNLFADFKALKKQLGVPKDLKLTTESGFTNEQAVRAYLFNQTGKVIPGLSLSDFTELNNVIEGNPKLQAFADQILEITKGDGYSTPGKDWQFGNISTDLMQLLQKDKRSKYLEEWTANKDAIFSTDNLNKLEAAYGPKYREALENSLTRMQSGSNRTGGGNRLVNNLLDYLNQSTAVTMFGNIKSGALQLLSGGNYINQTYNNPVKAAKAFANQPQYWGDVSMLLGSDYLVDRRNGLKLNIAESEIAAAVKGEKNKYKAALNYILEKGYLPTKYADSFAIAAGGALMYRNRINDLMKNGIVDSPTDPRKYTLPEAEAQALKEWRDISEKNQQSSDPSKTSQQQSENLGRVVLQYVNTPMQYARIQKRDVQDIVNKRAIPGQTLAESNRIRVGRIAYYGFLQNMVFNGLQQATFSILAGDEEELTEKQEKKLVKTANGMLDSSLRGLGLAGVSVQVIKNLGIDIYDRSKKDRPEYSEAYKKLLDFSPSIKRKLMGIQSAAYPFDSKKAREEVFEMGPYNPANPAYESLAKVITAATNFPLDRMYRKVENLKNAAADDAEAWQSVAMIMGFPKYMLEDEDKVEIPKRRPVKIKSGFSGSKKKKKIIVRN